MAESAAGPLPDSSPTASLTASVTSFRSDEGQDPETASRGLANWGWPASDDKAPACPRCQAPFTTTFRRHHCRKCAGLVCDNCSRHRLRLPQYPNQGKVRVCESCAERIGEAQATGFQEDLEANAALIEVLRGELNKSYVTCEAFKRVLLELEAEAIDDRRALEKHSADPENSVFAFAALRERAVHHLDTLQRSLGEQAQLKLELQERKRQAQQRLEAARLKEEELKSRHVELDSELAKVSKVAAERDALAAEEAQLERALAAARLKVRELEIERKERVEREAERLRRRASPQPSPPGSPPASGPVAFTISTGRQDPLVAARGGQRRDQCLRSSCLLM